MIRVVFVAFLLIIGFLATTSTIPASIASLDNVNVISEVNPDDTITFDKRTGR